MVLWTFALAVAAGPPPPSIVKRGDVFEFRIGDELVTKYHTRSSLAKPYLWPLVAPGGVGVTRDWPMQAAKPGGSVNEPHQKSAWFGHDDVSIDSAGRGKGTAFWTEGLNHGNVICTTDDEPVIKPDRATLATRNAWKTADGRVILDERREIALIPLEGARLVLLTTKLRASGRPVTFGDTKEGTLGVRVADALSVKGGRKSHITNASGATGESGCWGRKADWCDYSGEIDGKPVGVALFDDPANRWRACWHVREYGLLAANPFGRKDAGFPEYRETPQPPVTLKPGDELRLRYGVLLHTGDVATGRVVDHYRRFLALLAE